MDEFIQKLDTLLGGKIPEKIDADGITDPQLHALADRINQLIYYIAEIKDCLLPLSRGILQNIRISPSNYLASPFKALHSSLLHLTWQAGEVAKGGL